MAANNGYGVNQRKNLVILYQQTDICSIDMDMGHHWDLPKDSIGTNWPQRRIVPLKGIFFLCGCSSGVCPCLRRRNCGHNERG